MINIILADDHQVVIDGLKAILEQEQDIHIAGTANDGNTLLQLIEKQGDTPLVVLLDINMPGIDGVEAARTIRKKFPHVRILVLSMYNKPIFVKRMVESGVSGYVLKNTGREDLLKAIYAVSDGDQYFGAEVTRTIVTNLRPGNSPEIELTNRELEVVRLVAKGFSTAQIAEALFLSPYTVDTHRRNILSKLNLKNTAALVSYAVQNGLVDESLPS